MGIKRDRHIMAKGWGYYDVMHKDRRVARIYESGKCTVLYPSFMPYNLYLEKGEDTDTRVNNLGNFYYWCASRVLTLDRKYAKEILNSIGAIQACTDRERAAIAISYRALSLMDFNKAFMSYETTEGALCQTTDARTSQRAAAEYAVGKIGLNRIAKVDPDWFRDGNIRDMFFERLNILEAADRKTVKYAGFQT